MAGPKSAKNSRVVLVSKGFWRNRESCCAMTYVPSASTSAKSSPVVGTSSPRMSPRMSRSASVMNIAEMSAAKISSVNRVKNRMYRLALVSASAIIIAAVQMPIQNSPGRNGTPSCLQST